MTTRDLQLVSYQRVPATCEAWDSHAVEVAAIVADALTQRMPSLRVEHVGSTAVPGCDGKGIVDLAIIYPPGMLKQTRDLVDAGGFQRQQSPDPFPEERPMRVAALAHAGNVYQLHAHVLSADSDEVAALLHFRDRLRSDTELRQAYVAHKRDILAGGVDDPLAYCYAKGSFIDKALEQRIMQPERYQLIRKLFMDARELGEDDRNALLEQECRSDADLRTHVERLLSEEKQPTDFLATPPMLTVAVPEGATENRNATIPNRVGRYRIVRRIGAGGMGTVYEAEQESPKRTVALKVINADRVSPETMRRFQYETQALGRLQHPGIAQIFEADTFDAGHNRQPFFAMELIHGRPLIEYAAEHQLSTKQRLVLMARICQAVQHAHQRGIIHRDIKPANILVTDDGSPKILDFGVARATDSDLQSTTIRTDVGQLVGTIPYMSPEQVAADPDELDVRSDVYALGIVAYELLAGRLPYDLSRKMLHEAVRVIREENPTPLSSVSRVFRGDIDTIIAKALEKDKKRRYESAEALRRDVEHFLRGEPIDAKRDSTWYVAGKWLRRHRVAAGVAAAFVLFLSASTITMAIMYRNQSLAREEAQQARKDEAQRADELEQVARFQLKQLADIDVPLMAVRLRRGILDEARSSWERAGYDVIDARSEELEKLTAGADFTSLSLDILETNIFEPAMRTIDRDFEDQPFLRARLLQTLATTMGQLGLLDGAKGPQTETVRMRRQSLGGERLETITSLNNLGCLLLRQGRLEEAETHFFEALEVSQRVLGDDDALTLTLINNVGNSALQQGKLNAAGDYLRKALEGRRRVLGNEHPQTLNSINNIGNLLVRQGRLDEAEPYVRESLVVGRRILGDSNANTLLYFSNMGSLLESQGKLSEAEDHLREALEGRRRVLGDRHADTLISIRAMGEVLLLQGRLNEAEPFFRESLEVSRRVLGHEHPETLASISSMALLLFYQGKLADAAPYFHESLDTSRRVLGPQHDTTLFAIDSMGTLLMGLGQLEQAEAYYRQAVELSRKLRGPTHLGTLRSISNLGESLRNLGRLKEAERLGSEAVRLGESSLPAGHWCIGIYQLGYGETLVALRRFPEAESALLDSMEILQAALGREHTRTIAAMNALIRLFDAWHAAEPGKGYDAKAAAWRSKLSDPLHRTEAVGRQPE